MSALNFPSPQSGLVPEELVSLITLAACILMATNKDLNPEDAVGDALQVYGHARRADKAA